MRFVGVIIRSNIHNNFSVLCQVWHKTGCDIIGHEHFSDVLRVNKAGGEALLQAMIAEGVSAPGS